MISLYKRGRIWWIRGSYDGRRISSRSLDTSDRVVAEKRKRQVENSLDVGETPRAPVAEFVQSYFAQLRPETATSTKEKYARVIGRFVRFLNKIGIDHVGKIGPSTLADYLNDRMTDVHPTRKMQVGRPGLRADLLILHALFAHAVRSKLMSENPVSLRGIGRARQGETMPFTQDEIGAMLALELTPYLRALLLFFLHTGMRISDVSGMSKRAVNIKDGRLIWKTKKKGKTVFLPIHPLLAAAIEKHFENSNPEQRASAFLFPTGVGSQDHPGKIDRKLRRVFVRAGIAGGHAHRFRDTFAVRLLERGASLYDVAKLLGITVKIAEDHYSPYVQELQERARRFVADLNFVTVEIAQDAAGVQSENISPKVT